MCCSYAPFGFVAVSPALQSRRHLFPCTCICDMILPCHIAVFVLLAFVACPLACLPLFVGPLLAFHSLSSQVYPHLFVRLLRRSFPTLLIYSCSPSVLQTQDDVAQATASLS